MAGSSGNKANSAQLELELGLSLAIQKIVATAQAQNIGHALCSDQQLYDHIKNCSHKVLTGKKYMNMTGSLWKKMAAKFSFAFEYLLSCGIL